ncbi:hypothetical protein ACVWXN_006991 [Bradyrhizobium sp. i1.4.4]
MIQLNGKNDLARHGPTCSQKAFNGNAMAGREPGLSGREIVYSKSTREAGLNRELNDQDALVRRASVMFFIARQQMARPVRD